MSRDDSKILITGPSPRGWHRLQLAAECLQRYAWAYENGPKLDISKKPPLAIGTLIHLALAHHYKRMQLEQQGGDPDDYVEPEEAVMLVGRVSDIEKFIPVALDSYAAYKTAYPSDIHNMMIEDVEVLFDGDVGGYRLTGRIDLLYRDLGGRLWALDHKTTGRLTNRHKEFYAISGQMFGYQHLVRQKYGDQVAGMKINLIQHTKPKFNRLTLERSPFLESEFERSVVDIERSIERMKAENRPVDQWPKAMSELTCVHRYGSCDFIDQCRYGAKSNKAGSWEWVDE